MVKEELNSKGLAPLLVIIIAAASIAAGIGGSLVLEKTASQKDSKTVLASLVKGQNSYVDEEKLVGADSNYGVFTLAKTSEGEYILLKIVRGELKEDKFVGSLLTTLPDGELLTVDADSSYLPEVILKDKTKTSAQVIERMITTLKPKKGDMFSVKLSNASVREGLLEGIFSGQTMEGGYQIAGEIENLAVKRGYVETGASYLSPATRIFSSVLRADAENQELGAKVLAAASENQNPLISTFEDKTVVKQYQKGTYQLTGLEEPSVSLGTIKEIVNSQVANINVQNVGGPVSLITSTTQIESGIVTGENIASRTITGANLALDTVKNENIASNAINSDKIEDNTITASDLSSSLTFGSGDLIDLSSITHSSTSQQGLILPNVSSSSPSNPVSGKGYLAYDTADKQVLFYNGSAWGTVGSGTITSVNAGNGLSGGGSSGAVTLSVDTTDISTCTSNSTQKLIWDSTNNRITCGIDQTTGGSASSLSSITDALLTNTINNGDLAQIWRWSLTTMDKTAFKFTESAASTATGNPYILGISTLSGSTANPLLVTAGGTSNGVKVDTTGLLQAIGTGGIKATTLNGATFSAPGAIGGGTAAAGTFTTLTANTSVTDVGLSTAGVVTNTSGGLLGTLAGTTTTVLHGNASGAPTFGAVTGSDLASNITISTTGNLTTTGTGTITSAGAITGPTSTNTINNLIINSGALSGVTGLTFSSGNISGAGTIGSGAHTITSTSANALAVGRQGTTNPVLNIDASTASVVTGLQIKGAAAGGGVAVTTTSSGTNEALTIGAKGTGAITLGSGSTGDINFFTTSNKITSTGALTLAGAITAPTSTNTINGLIISSGALSGISTINASGQFTSTVTTGTPPFVIASTTNVPNLNASSLNGATFSAPGAIGGGTAAAGTFTTLTANTSVTDVGLSTAGVVTNTSGGLLGTLAGTTTTVLHGNASGAPTFGSITGSDLASNIAISTTGNISTTSTGTITSAGAITGPTSTNTINGLIINSGALSGISTITTSGAINKVTITAPATGSTLTIADGKTLTVNKSITLTAADDTGVYTFPTGTKTLVATDVSTLSSLTSIGTLGGLAVAGTANINTSGTSNTSIGNGTGTVTLTLGSDAVGDLYYRGSGGNLTRLADVATGSCLTSGGVGVAPSWGSCGGGSSSWSSLTNPSAGATISLDMNTSHTMFTWSGNTSTTDMFKLTDNATNTGTGYILDVAQVAGSTAKPLKVTQGANTLVDTTASGGLTLTSAGAATWGTGSGNLTLQVAGTGTTANIQIGAGGGGSATPDLLVLDQASGALPSGTNGAVALDSTGKFNIYEGGAWKVLCNKTDAACGAGSGSALSAITMATGGNTINSGDNAQVWNWSLTTASKTAFTFGENIASTNGAGSQYILGISTLSGSTANPLLVTAGGTSNGIKVDTNGLLQAIGTGGIRATDLAAGTYSNALTLSSSSNSITVGTLTATGGTINGVTIGGTSAGAGTFTTLTGNTSVTDAGLTTAGVVTNTSGGLLGTLAGTTTTVLHGNASGAPTFASISGSDLASNITISTSGNISTTGTGTITSGGAISGPTSTNTINSLIINSGALSGVTGITFSSGNISGAGTIGSGAITVTSTSTNALAVGRQGTTNPVLNIDASTASVVTGLNIKGAAAGGGLALTTTSSGTNEALTINSKGTGTVTIDTPTAGTVTIGTIATTLNFGTSNTASTIAIGTGTGANTINVGTGNTLTGVTNAINIGSGTPAGTGLTNITIGNTLNTGTLALKAGSGGVNITNTSANALNVGANGATNPVLKVDASTGSVATGLQVKGAVTGGTTALSAIDSGSNTNLSIDAKGTGTITLAGTSTGVVNLGQGLTFTGTTARTITGPGTGGLTMTVASGPVTVSTTGSGTLAVTSAGALNLTGAAASTWSTGSNTLTITSSNFNVTSGGALTSVGVNSGSGQIQGTGGLSITGTANINTSGTSNTSIGNGTGTITLTLGSDAVGDLYYRGSGGNITRLADIATGSCLTSGGVGAAPTWGSCGGGSGSLSGLTAATTGHTIDNGDNAQVWQWDLTTASNKGFTITENTASNATGTPYLFAISTITSSTANPLLVTAQGTANGVKVDTSGLLQAIGTGGIRATDLAAGTYSNALTLSSSSNTITAGTMTLSLGSDATGDLYYRGAGGSLVRLADVATGSCLTSGGVGAAPTWGSCGSGGGDLDSVYTADADKTMTVNDASGLTFNNTSTGDIKISDSGTAVFTVTGFSATLANGFTFTPAAASSGVSMAATGSDTDIALMINAKGAGTITLASGSTGDIRFFSASNKITSAGALTVAGAITAPTSTNTINSLIINSGALSGVTGITFSSGNLSGVGTIGSGAHTITSTSANALAVGANGTTNPILNIDASTASVATGLQVKGAAAGGGLAVTTLSSGTNEALTISAKGSGAITLASGSTGDINFFTTSNKITSAGALTVAGAISAPSATNTINSLIISSGALSGVTGLTFSSGNISGAGTVGSGAITVTSNSATALAVGANGATNPVLQVDASTGSVATGLKVLGAATGGTTALSVIDSGSNANLSISAKGTGTITLASGSTGNIQFFSSSNTITSGGNLTIAGNLTIGTSGAIYATAARPTRQVTLSPEYPGAVLTGSGSSNTGTMTSDFCSKTVGSIPDTNTSVCNTAADVHNYYQWTTTQGTAQSYDIWIRWRVPDNFAAWAASNPVKVYAKTNDTTNGKVNLYIYGTNGTVDANANNVNMATSATAWVQTSISSLAGTYSAGSYMTIRINMNAAATSGISQVGEISLDYLSTN